MNYEQLLEWVNEKLSTYQISRKANCSQTNIRYWLRKYGLNTNYSSNGVYENRNGRYCSICGGEMSGAKIKFCSGKCRKNRQNKNSVERQKRISIERKLKLIKLKNGECKNCGYKKNLAALCFHHKNPENKLFSLDSRKLSNTKWSSILIEVEKCELLCANCHFELHYPDLEMVGSEGYDP